MLVDARDLAGLYEQTRLEMGRQRGRRLRHKTMRVRYYPYAGLHSAVWDRGDHWEVRLSDLLEHAPQHVHQSLARSLIGMMDNRLKATRQEEADYVAWSRHPDVQELHERARRARGRKPMTSPRGRYFDLDAMFDQLNATYFQNQLRKPKVGWSRKVSRTLWAHHDAAHDAIVINRLLDHRRVPDHVVESVLYHEMLHIRFGIKYAPGGRRIIHSREFKHEEARFQLQESAASFLKEVEAGRIRLRPPRPLAPTVPATPAPTPAVAFPVSAKPVRPPLTGQTQLRHYEPGTANPPAP